MADIEFEKICKTYDTTQVLHNIDLSISDGEFCVFVGPSGCGKSTLLRIIAGLEQLTSGRLMIDGVDVKDLPPAKRGIAMVFQTYALYPHMSVFDNMAFGLKLAKIPKNEIQQRVNGCAEMLGITHLLDRKPRTLSGGQRQRVAIGRAIVREPKVFLLDEPLSNLDSGLRVHMRYEFAKLHQNLKATMVYVTHDQVEAMTLADKIVVLSAGRVEQVGAPMDLYENPANEFVAGFIGSPKMNFVPASVVQTSQHSTRVRLNSGIEVETAHDSTCASVGDKITLGLRPEHLGVGIPGPNVLFTEVQFVEYLGSNAVAYVVADGLDAPLVVQFSGQALPPRGGRLALGVESKHCHLFDTDGNAFPRSAA